MERTKWEVVFLRVPPGQDALEALNAAGQDGWEPVQIVGQEPVVDNVTGKPTGTAVLIFLVKRPASPIIQVNNMGRPDLKVLK